MMLCLGSSILYIYIYIIYYNVGSCLDYLLKDLCNDCIACEGFVALCMCVIVDIFYILQYVDQKGSMELIK
jgi:hypothetical protein